MTPLQPNTDPLSDTARDDQALAGAIGNGDGRAFESLMRRHNRRLYRIARAILKDDTEAEDALQEAYLAAYRNIRSFRGGSAIGTWLARIVINESFGRLRRRARAEVVTPFVARDDSEEADMPDDRQEPPEQAALRTEIRTLLERHIDALPVQFRTVFMLRDVEEMSVDEAAECLGVPPATIRTRAFRARALLRASLAREVDTATVSAFGFDGARCDRVVASVLSRIDPPVQARNATETGDLR